MSREMFSRESAGTARRLAIVLAVGLALAASSVALAQERLTPQTAPEGWVVIETPHGFEALSARLDEAVRANEMGLVTRASASDGARGQGIEIPGNRVVGVFRNDFARRMLEASVPAGIEAPIRFYLTENPDGSATLSYAPPSLVFAPYLDAAGPDLRAVAEELDDVFGEIAEDATAP
ncbi:DUF302 domain-containing protein [Salinarimonas sp.]|uniref:DUF302 domain-containing protein n=1 Tax=Salinarimonas sp. TaxID=2766526 RepID=UPI0032D9133C